RPVLIYGPTRHAAAYDRGGTRIDERGERGRRRGQQGPGGTARIGSDARQRHYVSPILPCCHAAAEIVGRTARRHRMRQRGEASRQLARGRIGAGIEDTVLAARGWRRTVLTTPQPARAQIEPPDAAFGAARLGAHRLLEAVEPCPWSLGGDVHIGPIPWQRDDGEVL